MSNVSIPKTIASLIQPSVHSLAARLFVLTTGRRGSSKYKPTVNTFYETGIVAAIYEHLLMSPVLQHLEIRHEMPYPTGAVGAPKRVDLWLRPLNGGIPHLIEAGDFEVAKVHRDLAKIRAINPKGTNWFLAFFRDTTNQSASDPMAAIRASLARNAKGLDPTKVDVTKTIARSFDVYRPDGNHDKFGAALIKAR